MYSKKFYFDVITKFKGYGIKYVFTLIFLGSFASIIFFIYNVQPLYQYFDKRSISSKESMVLDHLFKNWQSFEYDGQKIINPGEEVIYLKYNNKTFIAIDAENKLTGSEKSSIPIIFSRSRILFNFSSYSEKIGSSEYMTSAEYKSVFGREARVITSEYMFDLVKNYLKFFDKAIIYGVFPMVAVINFIVIFVEQSLNIFIVFFALKYFAEKFASFKTAARVVFLSSGI